MACPTCDHTMVCIGHLEGCGAVFHCERCGTVEIGRDVYVPKLVERCREFATVSMTPGGFTASEWHRIGIAESIKLPADRKDGNP